MMSLHCLLKLIIWHGRTFPPLCHFKLCCSISQELCLSCSYVLTQLLYHCSFHHLTNPFLCVLICNLLWWKILHILSCCSPRTTTSSHTLNASFGHRIPPLSPSAQASTLFALPLLSLFLLSRILLVSFVVPDILIPFVSYYYFDFPWYLGVN